MIVPIFLFIGILTSLFLIRSPIPGPSTGGQFDSTDPVLVYSGRTTQVEFDLKKQDFGLEAILVPHKYSPQGETVNISREDSPQISNEGVSFGGARRIAIRGETAYVADWFSGLQLYDIRNPAKPGLISSFPTPGSPKDVLLSGNTAILADDDYGISIIDITDPNDPNLVSRLQTPGLAYGLALDGIFLYLASHRGGFQIIDIGDTKNPRIIGDVETPGLAWGIDIRDQTVFIADDTSGILIYDASHPAHPEKIGEFNPGGQAEDVFVRGDHAFAVFFDKGLYILDVKFPSRPEVIAHLPTPGNARGIDIKNGHAFIADWEAGIQIVDISDLSQPAFVGSYDTDGGAWGVRIKGTNAFVMDWWGGFTVVDVNNPRNPVLSGRYHGKGRVEDLAVEGTYAFLANGAGGLQVFDIRNPFNPMWVTGLDELRNALSISVDNQLAYVGSARDGSNGNFLSIVDISNPFQLRLISKTETPLPTNQINVIKNRVYLSDLKTGIVVYDVTNPARPIGISGYKAKINDFQIRNNRLYLAEGDNGLKILDISDPLVPVLEHQVSAKNTARLLEIHGKEIFLYEEGTGIKIFSMNGGAIEPISVFNPGDALREIKVSGDTLYGMTESSTLMELDISDPRALTVRSLNPSDIESTRMDLSEDAVFFAGEKILRAIKPPPRARLVHKRRGSFTLTLPDDMQPGIYGLLLIAPEGRREVYPNVIRVVLPVPEEEFSIEDYQKLLKEKCPACPQ